jgi:hypothetical protein
LALILSPSFVARSQSFSSSMISMTACAEATASGLPAYVPPRPPAADHARQRHAASEALGDRHQVRRDVVVLHREQLAGTCEAGLHFVGDQQDAVRVADLAQAAHEVSRCLVEAAFALNRFEDDRGDALRIDVGLEQHLDVLERVSRADAVNRVGVRSVVDVSRERAEVQLVRRDFAGERHAHHRAAVEAACEGDHARTARRSARDLDSVFDGFSAGREERGLLREAARSALRDLLGQRDVRLVGDDLVSGVRELVELRLDGGDDLRMAVARVAHGDTGGEVDEAAAFDVPQFRVFGAFGVEVAHHAHAARGNGVLAALQIGVLAHVHLLDAFGSEVGWWTGKQSMPRLYSRLALKFRAIQCNL